MILDRLGTMQKEIRIQDESGDVTVIRRLNAITNLDLPRSVLSFELPEGVKINRLSAP